MLNCGHGRNGSSHAPTPANDLVLGCTDDLVDTAHSPQLSLYPVQAITTPQYASSSISPFFRGRKREQRRSGRLIRLISHSYKGPRLPRATSLSFLPQVSSSLHRFSHSLDFGHPLFNQLLTLFLQKATLFSKS